MISVCEDCEYTILIADLIQTIDKLYSFTLLVWNHNRDMPLKYTSDYDFHFLQEGIRVDNTYSVVYLYYDEMEHIEVVKSIVM